MEHTILYTTNAEADRVFLRDTLGLANIDASGGWLIFKLPPAEIAVHPTDGLDKQEFYFMCDDIDKTIMELTNKGVIISQPISDHGWGLLASIQLRSGADLPIHQPSHPTTHNLED